MEQYSEENKKHIRLKNDLLAPRFGKAEFTHHIISRDFYKKWKIENPKYAHFSYREFLNTWDLITGEIYAELARNPDGVRLPYYNGDLRISYVLGNKKVIDHATSNILNKPVGFLNWNTDKKPARVVWTIEFAKKRNRWIKLYGSEMDRTLNKEVFKALQTHPEIFRISKITKANAIVTQKIKLNSK